MAICVSTVNVTAYLTTVCTPDGFDASCNSSLPNGAYLSEVQGEARFNMSSSTGKKPNASTAFSGVTSSIVGVSFIHANQQLNQTTATEALFHFCVQTYEARVANGQPTIKTRATFTNFTAIPSADGNPYGHDLIATPPDGGGEIYVVNSTARIALTNFMKTVFSGSYGGDSTSLYYTSDPTQAIVTAITSPPYDSRGLDILLQNLAVSMTNK